MSKSIKFDDNTYMDAQGIYDTSYAKSQNVINLQKADGKSFSHKASTIGTTYTFNVPNSSAQDIYSGILVISAWDSTVFPTVYVFRYRVSDGNIRFKALTDVQTHGNVSSMGYSNGVLTITCATSNTRFINALIF